MNNNKNSGTIILLYYDDLRSIFFYCKNFNINFDLKTIFFTKNTESNNFISQSKQLKKIKLNNLKTKYKIYENK